MQAYKDKPFFARVFNNADGSANVGYVFLFWTMWVLFGLCIATYVNACIEQYYDPLHHFPTWFGTTEGLIVSAILPVLVGISTFIWADAKNTPQAVVVPQGSSLIMPPDPAALPPPSSPPQKAK